MIKSIKFTGKFGYITETISEPPCNVRSKDWGKKSNYGYGDLTKYTKSEQKAIKAWKKKYKEWEKHKNDYAHPQLVHNLLDRTIQFGERINLIFGPNASGKTTILKALAGNSGIDDGYPYLVGPMEINGFDFSDKKKNTELNFRKYLDKKMLNSAEIDWDGVPIYYDNFSNRQSRGSIGDLCGSLLNGVMDEVQYIITKNKISLGQNSIYLMNKLLDIASQPKSMSDIFKQYLNPDGSLKKDMGVNEQWADAYKVQLKYYLGFEKSFERTAGTFLLDEIDKSLDIGNIYTLYTDVLPKFVEMTGAQVIIISHSPLVLSDKIMKSDMYNFISTDEEYTKACIEKLRQLF